jgi:hypothetical protein
VVSGSDDLNQSTTKQPIRSCDGDFHKQVIRLAVGD